MIGAGLAGFGFAWFVRSPALFSRAGRVDSPSATRTSPANSECCEASLPFYRTLPDDEIRRKLYGFRPDSAQVASDSSCFRVLWLLSMCNLDCLVSLSVYVL
ncbi:hypothetical protein AXF42_Ash003887 [Apostasia shenzhenica]|uniref:Uncharacterized protein n=1 Tax=Apostasia shenzhenica TaxID=1088818 RepID=A0A2I0AI88_9ASPA|nr:hypothetical protein AXF42_Ash003887 [Apostasia shenzhenica]